MKILVVEDEQAIREVETAYLKRAGFDVSETDNGKSALDLIVSEQFDLLLLDLNLPGVNGLEICKQVRRDSTIPIIIVTAKVEEIDELIGLEAGADDYIKKPFSPTILVARVNNLLKHTYKKTISFSNLTIDPEKLTVILMDKVVQLTTTEFFILYNLAQIPGKVYSRSELLDKAYNDTLPPDILDRTIDAHIKNIRKKFAQVDSSREYIITVIGAGYKFIEQI